MEKSILYCQFDLTFQLGLISHRVFDLPFLFKIMCLNLIRAYVNLFLLGLYPFFLFGLMTLCLFQSYVPLVRLGLYSSVSFELMFLHLIWTYIPLSLSNLCPSVWIGPLSLYLIRAYAQLFCLFTFLARVFDQCLIHLLFPFGFPPTLIIFFFLVISF